MATQPTTSRLREKPQMIADELRALIVSGTLRDGDSLGREPDLVERFGVSRPSLREALRILEAEGLITVVRGAAGGVVVRAPDSRVAARTAALILQARNVSLADVYEARMVIEPTAAARLASSRGRKAAAKKLREAVAEQERVIDDPEAFGEANAVFHSRLVELAGNQTLTIVSEMLFEIVARAVTVVSQMDESPKAIATRWRGIRSQERLIELVEAGDGPGAEEHWRAHMTVVKRVMLGHGATTVVDLMNHI